MACISRSSDICNFFFKKKNVTYVRMLLLLANLIHKEDLHVLITLIMYGAMSSQAHATSLVGTLIAHNIVNETKRSNGNCKLGYVFLCIPSIKRESMMLQ